MEILQWKDGQNLIKKRDYRPVLALGNFDGVHLGHQKIIQRTIEKARWHKVPAGVLLFDPHPLKVIKSTNRLNLITDLHEKANYLKELGVDFLVMRQFTEDLAETSPEDFVLQCLVDGLRATGVVIGFDYSYGKNGKGKAVDLKNEGAGKGFFVEIVPPVLLEGRVVSSSLIRDFIAKGQVEQAAFYLGKYLGRKGRVIKGNSKGRLLGFPTANLSCQPEKIYPCNGVYLTMTKVEGCNYFSLTNIGSKPTFCNEDKVTMETHILDFNGDIYAKEIYVYFLENIRPEMKFSGETSLQEQIKKDISFSTKLIEEKYQGLLKKNELQQTNIKSCHD